MTLSVLAACGSDNKRGRIALVGATLINGTGEEPQPNSVIVVEGGRFRGVGGGSGTPIPFGSERVDLTGKYVMPELVNVMAGKSVEAHYTQKEMENDLANGATVLYGVPAESAIVPLNLLELIRSSNAAVAPMLAALSGGARLKIGQANVKTLIESGVMVAVASTERTRAGMVREMELLAGGGADPKDILVAATRNGAKALKAQDGSGTIQAGAPADLLVLPGNPLTDVSVISKVERVMRAGAWTDRSL